MFYHTLIFFLIAIAAGVLGFTGINENAVGAARLVFFVALIAFVISLARSRDDTGR